jgi:hypothetical protein
MLVGQLAGVAGATVSEEEEDVATRRLEEGVAGATGTTVGEEEEELAATTRLEELVTKVEEEEELVTKVDEVTTEVVDEELVVKILVVIGEISFFSSSTVVTGNDFPVFSLRYTSKHARHNLGGSPLSPFSFASCCIPL